MFLIEEKQKNEQRVAYTLTIYTTRIVNEPIIFFFVRRCIAITIMMMIVVCVWREGARQRERGTNPEQKVKIIHK